MTQTEILKENITLNFNSRYERNEYGYNFLECNPSAEKNYIDYMHEGALDPCFLHPFYRTDSMNQNRTAFSEKESLYSKDRRKEEANKVYKNRNNFILGGVIEFDGAIGYRLFQNFIDAKKFANAFITIISSRYGLDEKHLHYCCALHQNTIDRHIHFLIYSDSDKPRDINPSNLEYIEDQNAIIDGVVEFLNGEYYQTYLSRKYGYNGMSEEDKEDAKYDSNMFEYEIGCISLAKKLISTEDKDIESYEDLDVLIRCDVEEIAVKLFDISNYYNRKKGIIPPDSKEIIYQCLDFKSKDENTKLCEYFFEDYLMGCIQPTFSLIKEAENHLMGIKYSSYSLAAKRRMNKEYLKSYCDRCDNVVEDFIKEYEVKTQKLIKLYEKAIESEKDKGNEYY